MIENEIFREIPGTAVAGHSSVFEPVLSVPSATCREDTELAKNDVLISQYDMLELSSRRFPDRLLWGWREPEGQGFGAYRWLTRAQGLNIVKSFGTGLHARVKPDPSPIYNAGFEDREMSVVGIWSKNRPEWTVTDYGLTMMKWVSVPLYDVLPHDAMISICRRTNMGVLCCDEGKIDTILSLCAAGKISPEAGDNLVTRGERSFTWKGIHTIICFDRVEDLQIEQCKEEGVELIYFWDMIEEGRNLPPLDVSRSRDDISTIMFTSGSTGDPKGAVHTNAVMCNFLHNWWSTGNRAALCRNDSLISFLPLGHIFARSVELLFVHAGGSIGYYHGELTHLVDDMMALKPTVLIGVPRVWSRLFDKIENAINEKPWVVRTMVNYALNSKMRAWDRTGECVSARWDWLFAKVRASFGGRLRAGVMGGAPLEAATTRSLTSYLSIPILEGWGMTELGIPFIQLERTTSKGTIGGPVYGCKWRLKLRNEYAVGAGESGEASGAPAAGSSPDVFCGGAGGCNGVDSGDMGKEKVLTGELLVKSDMNMSVYLHEDALTKEMFDDDHYLQTGDIVAVTAKGDVRIMDRVKSFLKLQQGEYVAPIQVENVYSKHVLIDQIHIYGDSFRCYLVAIIVPNMSEVYKLAAVTPEMTEAEIAESPKVKKEFLNSINEYAKPLCRRIEVLKNIHLTLEPFTPQNGLLTPTMKAVRGKINERYDKKIKELYILPSGPSFI